MRGRFFGYFLVSLLATLALLGGAGWAVSRLAFDKPRNVFRTPYFEFELASGWWCSREGGGEYACNPPGNPPRSAIMIMAMKRRDREDTLAAYQQHLETAQVRGGNQPSQIRFVRRQVLGSREWIASLHSGSELATYDTYYLATTTSMVGIIISLSVEKHRTHEYMEQLNAMMATVRTFQR